MNKIQIIWIVVLFLFFGCTKNNFTEEVEKKYETIQQALDAQDLSAAYDLLIEEPNVNLLYNSCSLLYYFTEKKLTNFAVECINKGADVNWINPVNGETALCLAISNKNATLVEKMLHAGLNVNYRSRKGLSYLTLCLFAEQYEEEYRCVDILLQNSELVKIVKSDFLHFYSFIYYWTKNMPDVISRIYGDSLSIPDEVPVLIIAIEENNYDAVKYFLDKGIDPYKKYYDDLHNEYVTPLAKARYKKQTLSAEEFGIQAYSDLRNAIANTGLQAHHIIEKRFLPALQKLGLTANKMLSVAVTPEEHQVFTNAWRSFSNMGKQSMKNFPYHRYGKLHKKYMQSIPNY